MKLGGLLIESCQLSHAKLDEVVLSFGKSVTILILPVLHLYPVFFPTSIDIMGENKQTQQGLCYLIFRNDRKYKYAFIIFITRRTVLHTFLNAHFPHHFSIHTDVFAS